MENSPQKQNYNENPLESHVLFQLLKHYVNYQQHQVAVGWWWTHRTVNVSLLPINPVVPLRKPESQKLYVLFMVNYMVALIKIYTSSIINVKTQLWLIELNWTSPPLQPLNIWLSSFPHYWSLKCYWGCGNYNYRTIFLYRLFYRNIDKN